MFRTISNMPSVCRLLLLANGKISLAVYGRNPYERTHWEIEKCFLLTEIRKHRV